MPEELDITTQRLAAELASNILPQLTRSLISAVPAADFSGALERYNRTSQDLRSQIEKIIRSDIDENRAGRSVIMQSISALLEDISAVKRTLEKLPASIDAAKSSKPETISIDTKELEQKIDSISGMINELINGMKSFAEAYAEDKEQHTPLVSQNIYSGSDAQLEKLITGSLPSLEGLVRANAKSQSKELEDFSRELSALQEQNNTALIHSLKEGISEGLSQYTNEIINKLDEKNSVRFAQIKKMFMIVMCLSGASAFLTAIMIILTLIK